MTGPVNDMRVRDWLAVLLLSVVLIGDNPFVSGRRAQVGAADRASDAVRALDAPPASWAMGTEDNGSTPELWRAR